MEQTKNYTIGCDFGTLSMRTVIVDVSNGDIAAEHTYNYPHGVISERLPDSDVVLSGPHWALQHPDDYINALREGIPSVLKAAGVDKDSVIGIAVDFTTCTVLPMTEDGTVLCQLEEYRERPHAWVKLWKNHTANTEAEMFTQVCERTGSTVLDDYGFRASSEWFFPKVLEVLRKDKEVYDKAWTFIEGGDYIVYKLTGNIKRSSCFAAAKGLYDNGAHRYPPKEFFRELDPAFENVVEDKHLGNIIPVGSRAGELTAEMADMLGLNAGTSVCVAHADAAVALIGAGIVHTNEIIFVMGTSSCQIVMSDTKEQIPGMFGVYKDGVLPGCYTYEAGQGAVGDIFDWFCRNYVPASYYEEAEAQGISIYALLSQKAENLKIGESGLLALDWMNGNRCILQDSDLTGLVMGYTLRTKAEEVFRALVEATAFGTKIIMDAFAEYNVPINNIFACGGLAHKSPFIMQIYADIVNKDIILTAMPQTSALSSGIFAAVAAGCERGGYDDFETAVAHMVKPPKHVYRPIPENVEAYQPLFHIYKDMHDLMGRDQNSPLKRLRNYQKQVLQ